MMEPMRARLRNLAYEAWIHRYGFTLFAYIVAAIVTGVACVLFMWAFEFTLRYRLDFSSAGAWCWITTPLLFLAAVELVRRIGPLADGPGIPQVIFAARHLGVSTDRTLAPLTSQRTLWVKVASLLLGLLAGASTGREGPTVHIAACVFVGVILIFRRATSLNIDLRPAVIAGGAAGLAAAFNTPLAGVVFAIEELTTDHFAGVRDYVVWAIIAGALAARQLTGEYNYFGHLDGPPALPLATALLIGVAAGLLGAFFSTGIVSGRRFLVRRETGFGRYIIPVMLSLCLLLLARREGISVLGPGNKIAQILLGGETGEWVRSFPFDKMMATWLTIWSGIAGGIFAPSLSIGSALGCDVARLVGGPVESCALVGMGAFLAGVIQAPMTAFVIVFEMTGQHSMLLPTMLAALLASMTARLSGARHLYHALSENYLGLLGSRPASFETSAHS